MRWLFIFISIPFLFSSASKAEEAVIDPYEDIPENLAPQFESNPTRLFSAKSFSYSAPTWTYLFRLVGNDKTTRVLSEKNSKIMVKPASTMKIFTGWQAYKLKQRTNSYLRKMLRESVNWMADDTFEMIGGEEIMRDFYVRRGLPLTRENFLPADGSGLSYDNKATCDIEVKLLEMIRADESYETFKKLMAQPSLKGTLKNRLGEFSGKLFAKTGTLNKTAALSGFLETRKGTIVFCVMGDYLRQSLPSARNKIDSMVRKSNKQI